MTGIQQGIRLGFLLAGAYNIGGVLLFSLGFTNQRLMQLDPVFSAFGLAAIVLWGAAYAAVSRHYTQLSALLWVFCLEKLLYTCHWLRWLLSEGHTLPALLAESPLTAIFYAIYGAGDFGFAVFFAAVAWQNRKEV
ncbi:hypothetical protein [Chitinimonas sp.]|uniref:hypothetical protein n=1 Tax=Chitinimonas sp. TaxID=1934313 RepID=UPI0035B49C7C